MNIWTKNVLCACAVLVAFSAASVFAASNNPARGASLYEPCATCHTYTGKGIAQMPINALLQKMTYYKNGNFADSQLNNMQKALKPLTTQDLEDLAAYITQM